MANVALGLLVVAAAAAVMLEAYPLHASCKLTWEFSIDCSTVYDMLLKQISVYNNTDCGTTEKCGYALLAATGSEIDATHTTPVHHYVDTLSMVFASSAGGGCTVNGKSSSNIWYAVLDDGTNYCNLHNLLTGAGLNSSSYGFVETTSNSICTQYSSANCSVY
ncbi:hypothetical protein EMCRGX_G014042 [Ephydatia muelleri]